MFETFRSRLLKPSPSTTSRSGSTTSPSTTTSRSRTRKRREGSSSCLFLARPLCLKTGSPWYDFDLVFYYGCWLHRNVDFWLEIVRYNYSCSCKVRLGSNGLTSLLLNAKIYTNFTQLFPTKRLKVLWKSKFCNFLEQSTISVRCVYDRFWIFF